MAAGILKSARGCCDQITKTNPPHRSTVGQSCLPPSHTDYYLSFLPLLSWWQQGLKSATSSLKEAKDTNRNLRNPCSYESNSKLNSAFSKEKRTSVVPLEKLFFCQSGILHIWNMTYSSWFLNVENMEPSSAFFNTSLWHSNITPRGPITILLDSKVLVKPCAISYCQCLIGGCRSLIFFTKCLL